MKPNPARRNRYPNTLRVKCVAGLLGVVLGCFSTSPVQAQMAVIDGAAISAINAVNSSIATLHADLNTINASINTQPLWQTSH